MVTKKIEAKAGKANVSVKDKTGEVETTEEVGEAKLFDQPTCNVGVSLGATINTGDYNNVKVSVSLFMPCYPTEVDDVYEFTKEWVEKKTQELIDSVQED